MPYLEILRVFLRLGLTSFGGPVAHIGYFREEFVIRRAWVNETRFAHWLAICQALPGPASSQLGFLIGLHRGGMLGALLAWAGFTLPSAILLVLAATYGIGQQAAWFTPIVEGLKLVAVVVVAQALIGMFRSLCKDSATQLLSLIGFALALSLGGWLGQVGAIAVGALVGTFVCQHSSISVSENRMTPDHSPTRIVSSAMLVVFIALLCLLPWLAVNVPVLQWFDAFFRAGALVFGGGHVVLPLLESATVTPGLVSADNFLAGYGLAQAVPGPLFTFAAWLGTFEPTISSWTGACVALVAIFLPGLLLVVGVLPWWQSLAQKPRAIGLLAGINASVVGVLAAAWIDPVIANSIGSITEALIALVGIGMLQWRKYPAWTVVLALPLLVLLAHSVQL